MIKKSFAIKTSKKSQRKLNDSLEDFKNLQREFLKFMNGIKRSIIFKNQQRESNFTNLKNKEKTHAFL